MTSATTGGPALAARLTTLRGVNAGVGRVSRRVGRHAGPHAEGASGRSHVLDHVRGTKYLVADVEKAGGIATPSGKASAIETFEKFGLHRALRLARAKPGDTVRVLDLEVELWDYPPKRLDGWDGVADYPYVEIPPLRGQDPEVLRGWATDALPKLVALLTADSRPRARLG